MSTETAYAKAWREWREGKEGRERADTRTLPANPAVARFLENRLRMAFDAGWNARIDPRSPTA